MLFVVFCNSKYAQIAGTFFWKWFLIVVRDESMSTQ